MVNLDSPTPAGTATVPAPSPGPDPRSSAAAPEAPWPRSFTERFAQLAERFPDAPAIASPAGALTYRQAREQLEAVARGLQSRPGLRADAPVGVLVGATADSLVALLAVARTGRLVVPLDAQLPVARLREIAGIAGLGACVTEAADRATAEELRGPVPDVVTTGELLREGAARGGEALPAPGRGGDPLFVVFTSGSTGRPKGVLMTHDLLLSSAATSRARFAVGPGDRVALVLPVSFAAGTVVLATALLNGACAWTFDPRRHGARAVADLVDAEGLTMLSATPHLLRSVLATLAPGRVLASMRLVTTAGEAVFGRDVQQLAEHVRPGTEFWNWAGSSETGSLAGYRVVCGGPVPDGVVPAGVPEDGKEVRVLAPDGTPVPPGEPGEVFVTAGHLSAGYFGDPERTAERFTTEPDGRRTYRMGDLGRVDAAGDLHLLGRVDGAVKVRGYFVHLTEVEGAVLASPSVAEAVVVAVEAGGTHRLVAYVAPEPGQPTESPAALRRRLRERLPEYMVPGDVVPVPSLPRNERGKVDRAQLPPVPPRGPAEPPAGATEVALARTWAELLGLSGPVPVGADDDFQQLGADSLTVEEMLARVEDGFGVALLAGDLLAAPTLREFARRVEAGAGALPRHPTAVALRPGGGAPALFCFAGAGALAMSLKPLAAHVQDRAVVALHARGAESRALPDRSVRAAARRHLRDLRLVQPHGPYVLLGHSMGGLIALEVAQLLTDAGEEVERVVLVDTYLP
ncbi:AMP-binding protein, partial [Kineococcus indalonis]|uniref:AMP-binding protein n=1 Tax=Kineococcus indalonis TaxID=2696566 RepID=UPI00141246C8